MAFEWFKPWKWFQSEEREDIQEMKKQIENLQEKLVQLESERTNSLFSLQQNVENKDL